MIWKEEDCFGPTTNLSIPNLEKDTLAIESPNSVYFMTCFDNYHYCDFKVRASDTISGSVILVNQHHGIMRLTCFDKYHGYNFKLSASGTTSGSIMLIN